MKRRRFLIVLLILMILVMVALIGMFLVLRTAARAPAAVESPGFKHISSIYGWGSKPDELLSQPFSVTWQDGSLYVSDKQISQVLKFTPNGRLLARIGARGLKPEQIGALTGFALDEQGNVYAADGDAKKIVEYAPDGKFVKQVAVSDIPLTPLIDGNRMFLTTAGSLKVLQMPALTQLTSWGSRGRGNEQWDYPNGVTYDPKSGLVFVADGNNLRVKALNQQGAVVWIYGRPPENMNTTIRAFGLAGSTAFANGYLFVTDPLDSVIHIIDTKGAEVAQVGDSGSAEGQLGYPSGIAYMEGKRFAIAEWGNSRVQIVEIDVPAAIEEWQNTTIDNQEGAPGPLDGSSTTITTPSVTTTSSTP